MKHKQFLVKFNYIIVEFSTKSRLLFGRVADPPLQQKYPEAMASRPRKIPSLPAKFGDFVP